MFFKFRVCLFHCGCTVLPFSLCSILASKSLFLAPHVFLQAPFLQDFSIMFPLVKGGLRLLCGHPGSLPAVTGASDLPDPNSHPLSLWLYYPSMHPRKQFGFELYTEGIIMSFLHFTFNIRLVGAPMLCSCNAYIFTAWTVNLMKVDMGIFSRTYFV